MQNGQVKLVPDQVVHCVFKGAKLALILVVDSQHGVLIVVISLEARYATTPHLFFRTLPKIRR